MHHIRKYTRRGWSILPSFDHDLAAWMDCSTGERSPEIKCPVEGPYEHDATTDEAILDEWFARWPSLAVDLGLENSGFVVATVWWDYDTCRTELARQLFQLARPQIQLEVGENFFNNHFILQAPRDFSVEPFELDESVSIRSTGTLMLPCDCTGGGYDWIHDSVDVAPFPDWLRAAYNRAGRRGSMAGTLEATKKRRC
ncbi:MAG: bifunctional DNA primase/polymerase [Dehalococcoidia bacterium]